MMSSKMQVSRNRTGKLSARTWASAAAMLGMGSSAPAQSVGEGEQFPAVLVLDNELFRHFRRPTIYLDEPPPEVRSVNRAPVAVGREDEGVPPVPIGGLGRPRALVCACRELPEKLCRVMRHPVLEVYLSAAQAGDHPAWPGVRPDGARVEIL